MRLASPRGVGVVEFALAARRDARRFVAGSGGATLGGHACRGRHGEDGVPVAQRVECARRDDAALPSRAADRRRWRLESFRASVPRAATRAPAAPLLSTTRTTPTPIGACRDRMWRRASPKGWCWRLVSMWRAPAFTAKRRHARGGHDGCSPRRAPAEAAPRRRRCRAFRVVVAGPSTSPRPPPPYPVW